jgi:hypothetical protein
VAAQKRPLKLLQFLGRENGEDYGSEFLVMLNTWEAAVKFLALRERRKMTIEIAHFLGKRLSPARHYPLERPALGPNRSGIPESARF